MLTAFTGLIAQTAIRASDYQPSDPHTAFYAGIAIGVVATFALLKIAKAVGIV